MTRRYTSLGRYGGDEFLMVLQDARPLPLGVIAERMRMAAASGPVRFGQISIHVSVSVGVYASQLGRVPAADTLLACAARALHESKNASRHRMPVRAPDADSLLVLRIQAEYSEMPGLSLTTVQAARLWGEHEQTCQLALEALVRIGVLKTTRGGAFIRCT